MNGIKTIHLNYRAKLTYLDECGDYVTGHALEFVDGDEAEGAEDAIYIIDRVGNIELVPQHRLVEVHRQKPDEKHVLRYVKFNMLCEGQAKEAIEIIEEQFFGAVFDVTPGDLTVIRAKFCGTAASLERLLADCENTIACMELNTAGIYGLPLGVIDEHVAQEVR